MECGCSEQDEFWCQEEARIKGETFQEISDGNTMFQWMSAVTFSSRSRGRNRKKRRYPREVTLLQFGSDRKTGRWRYWSGEDRSDNGRNPWDIWAMEMLSESFLAQLETKGIRPEDYLIGEVTQLLKEHGERF